MFPWAQPRSLLMTRVACLAVALTLGCGGRSISGATDGGVAREASTHTDARPLDGAPSDALPPDADLPDAAAHAYVLVTHLKEAGPDQGSESLVLVAQVYSLPYSNALRPAGYVETLVSANGVACDIFLSTMMDDPDEPPPQIDGGRITAGPPSGGDDVLAVTFDAQIGMYTTDYRSRYSPSDPFPAWVVPGIQPLRVQGTGKAPVSSFLVDTTLGDAPVITVPEPDSSPLTPDETGSFRVAWANGQGGATLIVFSFNMDWDDATFMCWPKQGVQELHIPTDWLTTYSWGSGYMVASTLVESNRTVNGTSLVIWTLRAARRYASFEIW